MSTTDLAPAALDEAVIMKLVNFAIADSHVKLSHEPLPLDESESDEGSDLDDSRENADAHGGEKLLHYSLNDQLSAYRMASTHPKILRSTLQKQHKCQSVLKFFISTCVTTLQNSSTTGDLKLSFANALNLEEHSSLALQTTISNQSKAISAVKNQVASLPDFEEAISAAKSHPEEVLLYLAQLERQLENGVIDQSYWHLCLGYLSKDTAVTAVLTSFSSSVDGERPIWSTIRKSIISEWASHWNESLFFFQTIQRKQRNMKFTYFLMELKTRIQLIHRNLLDEPPELLISLLRDEILTEIFQTNRLRVFADMANLIAQVQAAISNKPNIDGSLTAYTNVSTPSPFCSRCFTNLKIKYHNHTAETCTVNFKSKQGNNNNNNNNNRNYNDGTTKTSTPATSSSSTSARTASYADITKSPVTSRPPPTCFICKQIGHISSNCPVQKN